MMLDIIVPEGVSDAAVVEILEQIGAEVAEEASLIAIETDKATAEVPAPSAGKLAELSVKIGDTVSSGDVIGKLDVPAEAAPPEAASAASSTQAGPSEAAPTSSESSSEADSAGPAFADIIVPEGVSDAAVVEILQEIGAEVAEEASLIAIETDKATAEVPAPSAGKLSELNVKIGDTVSSGDVIGKLQVAGKAAAESSAAAPAPDLGQASSGKSESKAEAKPEAKSKAEPNVNASASGSAPILSNAQSLGAKVHASPSVRSLARELGVDLALLREPSGPKGRITFGDVKAHVKNMVQAVQQGGASLENLGNLGIPSIDLPDFSQFGPTEEQALSKIKQVTGQHLSKGWLNIPLVTHFEEADISELEDFRKSLNSRAKVAKSELPKTTALAFIVKAVVRALQQYPQLNSSLAADGKSLILKRYYNIAIAVDTPKGLLVPVIPNAEQLSLDEISQCIINLGSRGRAGKLGAKDMQGASFTISSLGGLGGTNFTPLVNPPEAAILGVAKAAMKPVWNGSEFVPRLILPFSISYDHRILDGGEVARFGTVLASYLQDLRNILV